MFNQLPTVDTIDVIRRAHLSGGTTAMLPTLITDDEQTMTSAVDAVAPALHSLPGIVGIRLEGPHRLTIACKTRGKPMLVSDAMATVGSEVTCFELYGETINAVDGRCATADGTLAGSALDMVTAVRNCVNTLDIPLEEALRMASQYPAEFLSLDHSRGHIRRGYRANLVLLNPDISPQQT